MKKIIVLLSMLLLVSTKLYSQLDCTNDDPNCTNWLAGSVPITITLDAPECEIIVTYDWRICNGVYEYNYTSITASGNCTQMANFSIYEYDFSSILEMADMILAEEEFDFDGHPNAPGCSSGFITKAKIYSAACGVWVKCSYEYDLEGEIKKDIGYEGDCPVPYLNPQDGKHYIDVWKWQSCGEVCCRREYDICWYNSPITGSVEMRVTQYPGTVLGNMECTLQDNFAPWENPLNPYQCNPACF